MRRWFAGFLAAWILMGPVLSLSAGAAEIEQPLYSAAVPETTAETTETSTEATTEHIPEDTTAATEETVNSAEAADTTAPTVEKVPVETVPATISTAPTETVPTTVPETQPTTEESTAETQSQEIPDPAETIEETQPAEETPPKKSLWETLLEFLGLMEEGGSLESLSLSDAQGNALALTPEFTPNCHTYGTQVPASGELSLTLEPGADYQIYVNGTVLEENRYVFTPQWDSQGLFQLNLTLLGKSLHDEDEYTLSLVPLPPAAQSIEITRPPEKTEYQAGETFDPTGLAVKVTLSDGTTLEPETEALTFSPAEGLTAADTAVTVQYEDASAQIEVRVSGLEGKGEKNDPYLLKTQEDLFLLDEWVTAGEDQAGLYFQLTQDIEITDSWDGIGDENHPFSGIFNGRKFQITIPEGGKALFSRTREATVRNLKVYGPRIEDYGLVSNYVVDYDTELYVTFRNVTLVSGTQTLYSGFIGGYASGQDAISIINCTIEPDVIIGYDKSQSHIGSFAGEFNGSIQNSTSAATVYGVNYVGGLVGNKGQSMGDFEITGSSFTGTLSATGKCVGGIVGGGYAGTNWSLESAPNTKGVVIEGCTSSGSISGGVGVGGIFGAENCAQQFWDNGICSIKDNTFTGSVRGSKFVGGIIGFMQSLNADASISNNYYKNASQGIGGVAHVDTSALSNGFHGDTYYYNTSKYVSDGHGGVASYDDKINCVPLKLYIDLSTIGSAAEGVNRAVSKPALNRTDDPLGADLTKLCHTDAVTEKRVTKLTLSGSCKTQYTEGEALDLTGLTLTATWSTGETTEVSLKDVTVSGYNKDATGEQAVRLTYQGAEARLTVTVKPKSTDITVTVTILGDSKHSANGSIHGLAMGGLTTWVSSTKITAKSTNTVWDVLQPLLDEKGYTYSVSDNTKYGSVYIASINGLGEFTNGPNSGWMYTFNGTHPNRGVSAYYLKDNAKIVLHYTDDYTYEEGGENYGKTPGSENSVKEVIALIQKIGTVAYTDACKNRIDDARKAYDALTPAEKDKVANFIKTLTEAEAKYEALKQAAQKANAEKVIKLIKAIPNPVTKASKAAIDKARKAYDGLTEEEQKLVTNLKVLTGAEAAYAKLTATKADLAKAQAVMDAIKALPASPDAKALKAVRKAYDRLTARQKLLVENYGVLEAAEARLSGETAVITAESRYKATGEYIQSLGTPSVGPIGGEWGVLGLARSGLTVPGLEDYCQKALEFIRQSIDPATMRLHSAKSTDNSRMILALTAIGKGATNIDGYNLVAGLSDLDYVTYQGNNGPIWALIALDSGNYPASGTATRQALVDELLRVQTSDGGWAVTGSKADTDMTGMALQALAPYYETNEQVRAAVDRAIDKLSRMQQADGSFCADYGDGNPVATSESIAQVITGLTALGIDPATDPRFVKSGGSALDALLRYYVDGGGFRHLLEGERDGMATEQGYYALTAYFRFRNGETALYDMTDVLDKGGDYADTPAPSATIPKAAPEKAAEKKPISPLLIIGIALMALGAGTVAALVILRKTCENEE